MWVDVIVDEILASRPSDRYVINDAWSPSGPVHMGSLRGVILHDSVARGLQDAGRDVEFIYGFDDYDPLDSIPAIAPPEFRRYLGMPLSEVPSPAGDGMSFARHYALEFAGVFNRFGVRPAQYWTSEMYTSGRFNDAIRTALDRADELIQIDREISGSRKAERHPVQVVCEHCGRVGTTVVTGWDGRVVSYECRADKVTWAAGCGHRGARSPFDGGSKLQYIVEWAAKWKILGVSVEGAGKDHMTKGGSHDRASAMVERVFDYPTPYAIAYEYFLTGGRKMASSTGLGTRATDLAALLRPDLARFLIVRPLFRQQINFDPGGEAIPTLYDDYDRAAAAYFGEAQASSPAESETIRDYARTFYYARTNGEQPHAYRMRFTKVAHLIQMPNVDLVRAAADEKGAPLTDADREELALRAADARRWLQTHAPASYRFEVQPSLPPAVLSGAQRRFLGRLADIVADGRPDGDSLQAAIHTLKNEMGLPPKDAFGAIYQVFLGKESGPQAGWLLASLDRDLVVTRLRDAAS
ncbi:MAG TPA: lysine--tRNA ligase [bacterium]|nr:lysine--tRNA ligase [bacterium]